jgi:L-ascorbate metabolism protein UlaG (beta-lactamase superfamily)
MDAPEIATRTGANIYGSPNTCRIMQAAGVPEKQLNAVANGENFRIGRVRVYALPAYHPWLPGYGYRRLNRELKFPAHLSDYRMDACYSYLLETEDKRILIWSSTHWQGAPRADLLTCRAVSSVRWYCHLLQQVQPKMVIPQHWDDFFQPLSDHPAPFWSSPQLRFPPIARIDLEDFD